MAKDRTPSLLTGGPLLRSDGFLEFSISLLDKDEFVLEREVVLLKVSIGGAVIFSIVDRIFFAVSLDKPPIFRFKGFAFTFVLIVFALLETGDRRCLFAPDEVGDDGGALRIEEEPPNVVLPG